MLIHPPALPPLCPHEALHRRFPHPFPRPLPAVSHEDPRFGHCMSVETAPRTAFAIHSQTGEISSAFLLWAKGYVAREIWRRLPYDSFSRPLPAPFPRTHQVLVLTLLILASFRAEVVLVHRPPEGMVEDGEKIRVKMLLLVGEGIEKSC